MKTLKKLLFIIMAVAVLAMPVFGVQAAESDIPVTEQPGVSPTPSPVPIRELVTKGNKIYYYYKKSKYHKIIFRIIRCLIINLYVVSSLICLKR